MGNYELSRGVLMVAVVVAATCVLPLKEEPLCYSPRDYESG